MSRHLHIVTHDIPWPADYGGVMDLFYKIKALHSFGIKIHLHCFTGGRSEQHALNKYCESIFYYPRKKGFAGLSLRNPYIVQSRSDSKLLKRLQSDHHPIVLEGIHCTYFLENILHTNRKIFVRLHNVEYKYYQQLANNENNLLKKAYFKIESSLLKNYEQEIAGKAVLWAVSMDDEQLYKNEFHAINIHFLPVFLPWDELNSRTGRGDFCLYHGNLAVNENQRAAEWLLKEVFNDLGLPLVIAGKSPTLQLQALAKSYPHVRVISDPSEADMQELIASAQVNVLPSFNSTGIKLKLLNALYNGRHCLVNVAAAKGSGMEEHCSIASGKTEFKSEIRKLYAEQFTAKKMQHRDAALKDLYHWEKNAKKLIAWIY